MHGIISLPDATSYDKLYLSYDVVSGSVITLCIKIDKPLVNIIFFQHCEMKPMTYIEYIWAIIDVFKPKT